MTLVITVESSVAPDSAARPSALTFESDVWRYAVPICTPAAPSAKAAAMPRPSAMPPAAITGTFTASTTCGTSDMTPGCDAILPVMNMLRCPPASAPCAMMASAPFCSSQTASFTRVAQPITTHPVALTRSSSDLSGRPKWKLTTSGFNSSTSSHIASSKGARAAAGTGISGSSPSSSK